MGRIVLNAPAPDALDLGAGAVLTSPRVSIVIPARNNADALARTLDHLGGLEGMAASEVIVAASGDPVGTERALAGRARLLRPDGSTRAELMNAGAAAARGDVLFFLHADSFPPRDALARIRAALADPRVAGGAFEHLFAEPSVSLRLITWINRVRYRLTRNYYGDQGIFARASVFRELGGYRSLRLMEDLDFARRLRRRARSGGASARRSKPSSTARAIHASSRPRWRLTSPGTSTGRSASSRGSRAGGSPAGRTCRPLSCAGNGRARSSSARTTPGRHFTTPTSASSSRLSARSGLRARDGAWTCASSVRASWSVPRRPPPAATPRTCSSTSSACSRRSPGCRTERGSGSASRPRRTPASTSCPSTTSRRPSSPSPSAGTARTRRSTWWSATRRRRPRCSG